MKLFYKATITASLVIAIFSCVLYTACSKNKCGNTTCQNNGTCINNACVCETGFSGSDCSNSWSTPFLGTFTCTQTCRPGVSKASWISTITTNSNSTQDSIVISNFGNYNNNTVYAGVDSSSNIFLASSTVNTGIVGKGKISNDSIIINYTSGSESCTMIFVKQ